MVEYQLDAVFDALAHPARRDILDRLVRGGEATVTEIAAPYEVSLNAVSKHLKVLERAGLIRREVVGREHRCRFEGAPLESAGDWIETARRFWTGALDQLDAHLKKTSRRRTPPSTASEDTAAGEDR